jgi:hypothetical protein
MSDATAPDFVRRRISMSAFQSCDEILGVDVGAARLRDARDRTA